jgi:hypothetical protein
VNAFAVIAEAQGQRVSLKAVFVLLCILVFIPLGFWDNYKNKKKDQ